MCRLGGEYILWPLAAEQTIVGSVLSWQKLLYKFRSIDCRPKVYWKTDPKLAAYTEGVGLHITSQDKTEVEK